MGIYGQTNRTEVLKEERNKMTNKSENCRYDNMNGCVNAGVFEIIKENICWVRCLLYFDSLPFEFPVNENMKED